MEGVPAKDDKAAKPPVDTVTLTALGNAISVACFIGGTLEKEGLATIASALASKKHTLDPGWTTDRITGGRLNVAKLSHQGTMGTGIHWLCEILAGFC